MTAYDLPTSLPVGGVEYEIRSDFRSVIDILSAMNDPDLNAEGKAEVILKIMYPGWRDIPPEHIDEALQKACEFIDCGQKDDGRKSPRVIDWEQDAQLIISAVNGVAHTETRAIPNLHWWTFFGWFMEIGDSTISTVIHVRKKLAEGKPLDKAEKEFYRNNRGIVQIETKFSQEEQSVLAVWGAK